MLAVTDHFSNRRYPILKERLRRHLSWLADHQGSKKQQGFEKDLQRMTDLLSTHDDYEKELAPLLERNRNLNPTRKHSQISHEIVSGAIAIGRYLGIAPSQSTSNHAHRPESRYKNLRLPHIDDAEFLTELCLLRDEHPAYVQIAGEIIQEATESLGAKLKWVSTDIAYRAEREIGRLLQEVLSSFAEQRLHAEQAAHLELMDLIRRDLDEEPRHPIDPYVLRLFALTSIDLIPYRTRVVIRKVIVDNSGFASEQIQLPPLV